MYILFCIGLIVFCLYLILPIIYIAFFITRYLELMSNSCDVVFCMLIQSLSATYSLYVKFSKKVYQLNYFTKCFRKNLKTYWLLKEINLWNGPAPPTHLHAPPIYLRVSNVQYTHPPSPHLLSSLPSHHPPKVTTTWHLRNSTCFYSIYAVGSAIIKPCIYISGNAYHTVHSTRRYESFFFLNLIL